MPFTRLFSSKLATKEKGAQKLQKPSVFDEALIDDLSATLQSQDLVNIPQGSCILSPLQLKQWRAREAMMNLQTPPKQTRPQWTPEHHRVLSENVQLLVDATSDPKVTNNIYLEDKDSENDGDVEDDGNYEGGQENEVENKDTGGKGGVQPTRPPKADSKQLLTPENSMQGQKRQREEQEDDPNRQDAQATKRQRSSKRTKLRTGITEHVLEEFETLKPQPLQFTFREHPAGDRSDEWYIGQFCALFRRIRSFAHDFFGLHDIDEGGFYQPWAAGMSLELIRHVEDVAEADPMTGGWDTLLQNTIQREWLIVALIIRILEVQVFDADLWGAEEHEKDLLFNLERALFVRDAFPRTALRSRTVRTIIGQRPITQNFHAETAKLTAKVAILLKPLTFFLYSRPTKDGGLNRKIEEQYQALHNIIAIAAYLSICIRLSPTIFYFSNVSPNTRYEEELQHSVDAECYTKSKEAVINLYEAEEQEYIEKLEVLEDEIAKLQTAGKSETSRIFKKAQAKLEVHMATQPNVPANTHEAMTKIGVWPNISRFKPGETADDDAKTPLEKRKGVRIFEICKSAVVCYYNLGDQAKRTEQTVKLEHFVQEKVKRYGKKERGLGKGVVLVAAAAATAGIPYLLYGWNVGLL